MKIFNFISDSVLFGLLIISISSVPYFMFTKSDEYVIGEQIEVINGNGVVVYATIVKIRYRAHAYPYVIRTEDGSLYNRDRNDIIKMEN